MFSAVFLAEEVAGVGDMWSEKPEQLLHTHTHTLRWVWTCYWALPSHWWSCFW